MSRQLEHKFVLSANLCPTHTTNDISCDLHRYNLLLQESSETVSAFNTTLSGVDTTGKMNVSPFAVNEAVTKLTTDLKEETKSGNEIRDALKADVTTVHGQRKLLQVARENNWFEKDKEDSVIVAERDGIEGFLKFRDTFSEALSFFWCSIEGNHRIIAALCALFKCIPKHNSPIRKAEETDEHFFSGQHSGIEADDPLKELHTGEVKGLVTHFRTIITVDLLGSKLQATENSTAQTLENDILLSISKMIATEKHGSSYSTLATNYILVANRLTPDKDMPAQTTNGMFYCNGSKIEEKAKKDIKDPKDGAFQDNQVLNNYLRDSSVLGSALQALLENIHFTEEGTNKRICIPARMSVNTAIQDTETKSLKTSMAEIIGTALAEGMKIGKDEREALLFAKKYYDNSIQPQIDLNDSLAAKLGVDLPELFDPHNEKSVDLSVLHFITEWIVAANMNVDLELLQKALDKLSRELSNMGEKEVKDCLGEQQGE
eukprot:scaffold4139_cov72-Skeletonema_menzelii.AAC.3